MLWDEEFKEFCSGGNHQSLINLSEEIDRNEFFLPWHYGKYIASLFSLGFKEKGCKVTDEAIIAFPNDCSLRIRHAENAMSSHDWDSAVLRWKYVLDNFKSYPQGVFWRLANAYLKSFQFSEARGVVEKIGNLYGDSQKLNDLVSLIESSESKRYFITVEKLSSNVRCYLESTNSQKKIGRVEDFFKYRVHGWVKVRNDENFDLLVKNSKGETTCFDLNKDRDDVRRHFKNRGEGDVGLRCGFDYIFDVSRGFSVGFLNNGSEEWAFRFKLSGILSVLEGVDGWLFLDNDSNRSVSQFTGETSLSKDMFSKWEGYAEELNDYDGVSELIYFIANSKESVVPEFYPYQRGIQNICDEVESILLDKKVNYLNPREMMSREDGAYYKTDTHWSDYGGYLGYLAVMERCGFCEVVKDIAFEEIEVTGDLGSKLSPVKRSIKKVHRYHGPTAKCIFRNGISGTGSIEVWGNPNAAYSKTVVLFGGSSLRSGSFFRYFCYSFCRVVVVNLPGSLVDDIVSFESPDLVVVQTNERYLLGAGKIYKDCESSPVFVKLSSLPIAEKEEIVEEMKNYSSEEFYIDKTIGLLGLSQISS